MKKYFIIVLVLVLNLPLAGQFNSRINTKHRNRHGQSQLLQKIDSVVNYLRVDESESYLPVDVFIYNFDGDEHYPAIERLSLPSREKVNKQNYFYDNSGRKSYYILQVWSGSEYVNRIRTDFFYDDQGQIKKEVYSGFGENNSWLPYQQHLYNHDENQRTISYLRQMKNSTDYWYDFSYKNYLYNEEGRLMERNEQRIADNVIFWKELFTYDDMGRTATRVRQTLKYDPTVGKNVLINLNKQIYAYDFLGELSGYDAGAWVDSAWVFRGRTIYYRSLIKGKKVDLCHNGHTITVSINALEAHLRHGDTIGPCDCDEASGKDKQDKDDKQFNKEISNYELMVYPNPFVSEVTMFIPKNDDAFTSLAVYSKGGTILVHEKISNRDKISLNLAHLKSGVYYITIYGDQIKITKTIIKK